jgi:ribosomal protein S24E
MSLIETVSDVNNTFLSRRELTCNFAGLGGKLKKIEAIDMISKEFKLDGKVIIPMKLQTHVGKPLITGTFYVYDDEKLAKEHVNPAIFSRLEKAKKPAEEKPEVKAEEKPEVKAEEKSEAPKETKAEEKKEEKPKESE